jgi:hypothetical protein
MDIVHEFRELSRTVKQGEEMAGTGKVTKTFSLTETTDELLSVLSRVDERPRSAELRFMIIRYAEHLLADGSPSSRVRRDVRTRIERLVDQAKSEVYEPEDLEGDDVPVK